MDITNKSLSVLLSTLIGIIVSLATSAVMNITPVPIPGLFVGTVLGMLYGFYIMQFKNPISETLPKEDKLRANRAYRNTMVKFVGIFLAVILVFAAILIK